MNWSEIIPLTVSVLTALYLGYDKFMQAQAAAKSGDAAYIGGLSQYAQNLLAGYSKQVADLQLQLTEVYKQQATRTSTIRDLETRIDELENQVKDLQDANDELQRQLNRRGKRGTTGSLPRSPSPVGPVSV